MISLMERKNYFLFLYMFFLSMIIFPAAIGVSWAEDKLNEAKEKVRDKRLPAEEKVEKIVTYYNLAVVLVEDVEGETLGSGFLIKPNGFVLTTQRILGNRSKVKIKLADKREFAGKIKRREKCNDFDLAMIKIDGQNLPFLDLGDSGFVRPVDTVIALGYPFKNKENFSKGLVYGIEKAHDLEWLKHLRKTELKPYDYLILIKTEARVPDVYTGSPLLNLQGEVIGVNTIEHKNKTILTYAIAINELFEIFPEKTEKEEVKTGEFDDQTRGIKYAMYVPSYYSPHKKWPLILAFHPTGDAKEIRDFWIDDAEKEGFIIACGYVEGDIWHTHDDYRIFEMIKHICKIYNIDKNRIYLTGLSGGAVFAYYLGINYPELFAAMAPISGCMFNIDDELRYSRRSKKQIPVLIVQGSKDTVVTPDIARNARDKLKSFGYKVDYLEIKGMGHEHRPYKSEIYKKIIKFFNRYK